MSSFTTLGSAIYSRMGTVQYTYNTGGTVTATSTLGLYDGIAPQGTNPPYNVFQFMASLDDYAMSSKPGESADYMFKTVSNRNYPSQQAYQIYEQGHTVLQGAPLTVAGNTLIRVQRRNRFVYQDSKGFWHVGGNYRVETWQT